MSGVGQTDFYQSASLINIILAAEGSICELGRSSAVRATPRCHRMAANIVAEHPCREMTETIAADGCRRRACDRRRQPREPANGREGGSHTHSRAVGVSQRPSFGGRDDPHDAPLCTLASHVSAATMERRAKPIRAGLIRALATCPQKFPSLTVQTEMEGTDAGGW